jgi:hypothetical protein
MIQTSIFNKVSIENRKDFMEARGIADKLVEYLNQSEIQEKIKITHELNASSQLIQKIFEDKAREWGFASEKNGLFEDYQLRPDYYMPLSEGTGILLEVERGKTLANNMDLLDVWKCHICKEANFLFLVVPQIRQKSNGHGTTIYNTVLKRLQAFFKTENYVNVDAVFVFGY